MASKPHESQDSKPHIKNHQLDRVWTVRNCPSVSRVSYDFILRIDSINHSITWRQNYWWSGCWAPVKWTDPLWSFLYRQRWSPWDSWDRPSCPGCLSAWSLPSSSCFKPKCCWANVALSLQWWTWSCEKWSSGLAISLSCWQGCSTLRTRFRTLLIWITSFLTFLDL